jgi:iron complex outermembrane recepter protein
MRQERSRRSRSTFPSSRVCLMRKWLAVSISLLLGATSSTVFAQASNPSASLQAIAPMPLAQALDLLSQHSGLQIVYHTDVAATLRSSGAAAGQTSEQQLRQLLKGTGLDYRFITPTTVTIEKKPAADAVGSNRQGVRSGQSMTSLETVNVSAASNSGGFMSPEDADKAESDLTAQALRKLSPTVDPLQAMASMPGVYMSSPDPVGLQTLGSFMVNGFDVSRLSYTLDGVPMNEAADYGVYSTFLGDTQNIDDINVAAGLSDIDTPSVSAEGGHVNQILRQPATKAGVYFEDTVGSDDIRKEFIRFDTGQTGPLRSWISFSRTTSNIWQGNGNQSGDRVQAKTVWDISPGNSVSGTVMYFRTVGNTFFSPTHAQYNEYGWDYGYGNVPPVVTVTPGKMDETTSANNYYALYNSKGNVLYVSLDGEFKLSDSLNLSVIPYYYMAKQGGGAGILPLAENAYYAKYGLPVVGSYPAYPHGQTVDLNHDGDTLDIVPAYLYVESNIWRPGINTKLNYSDDHNNVTGGVWYESYYKAEPYTLSSVGTNGQPVDRWAQSARLRLPNGTLIDYENYYVKSRSAKAYLDDSYTINDQWKLSAGIASQYISIDDYNNATQVLVSPNKQLYPGVVVHESYKTTQGDIGLSYAADDNNSFFFHSSTGYRPPIAKTYWNYNGGNIDDLYKVKPETTWTNQLGWRYNSDNFMASTTLLDVNYKNYQATHYDQNLQLEYFNAGAVKQYGALSEVSWRFQPSWIAYASYTYLHARQQSDFLSNSADGEVALPTAGKRMAGIPQNMAALSLEYDLGSAFFRLSGKYNGARYGDLLNTDRVGGYTTYDFNAGYTFADWGWLHKPQLRVSVLNLLDRHYLGYVYSTTTNAVAYKGVAASLPTYLAGMPRTEMLSLSFEL